MPSQPHSAPLHQRLAARFLRYCDDCRGFKLLKHSHVAHPNLAPWWVPGGDER